MNQTKKRLSIINLAISITDIETIQLQILKLRILHSDEKIQEIITTLQEENYAQAQTLIKTYIETPNHEILQRSFQQEKERQEAKDKKIIDEFDLFTVESPTAASENKVIELNEMMQMNRELQIPEVKEHEEIDFDSLLNVKTDDIMPDNIDIDINDPLKNDFWNTLESSENDENPIEKDTFFDNHETSDIQTTTITEIDIDDFPEIVEINKEPEPLNEEETLHNILEKVTQPSTASTDTATQTEAENSETLEEAAEAMTLEQMEEIYEQSEHTEEIPAGDETEETSEKAAEKYKAISYIDQKLKNLQVQYPAVAKSAGEAYASVTESLAKIAREGYTEEDIGILLKKVSELKEEKPEEAVQLLLLAAATESKYAQFQLARTLFRGEILQKNIDEAFTLMNRLAVNEDYPEAICDLAQFYEYGIGVPKDKNKAELLYEEASDLGIQRATPHYERLRKENKGFLSFLTK